MIIYIKRIAVLVLIVLFHNPISAISTTNQQDNEDISERDVQDSKTKYEAGATFGVLAGCNFLLSKHFDAIILRVSGMAWSKVTHGIQLDVAYKFSEHKNTYHAINLVGGTSRFLERDWTFAGLAYNLNTCGFYFQAVISTGKGDFRSPYALIQLGYAYQFK